MPHRPCDRPMSGRRAFVAACAALVFGTGAGPAAVAADAYPTKPIRVIVNSAPGGLTDIVARIVTTRMAQAMGHAFVVDNRPGVAVLGADAVAKSVPDGYTVGVLGNSLSALPAMMQNLPFSPEKDLVAIALLNTSPLVMVTNPKSPYRSPADYVNDARAKPGQLAFASGGNATMTHLLAEQLQATTGISLIHVPYKGGAPALAAILSGEVPVMFDTVATTVPQAREGKVRALAIVAKARSAALPDVPTLAEAGFPEVQGNGWFALFAPAGTPPEVVTLLNAEANKALASPEVRDRLLSLGTTPEGGSPKVLSDLLASEIPRWTRLIRERGIKSN